MKLTNKQKIPTFKKNSKQDLLNPILCRKLKKFISKLVLGKIKFNRYVKLFNKINLKYKKKQIP